MTNVVTLSGISLFSGAGGMDVGFTRAGIDVVWANDIDPDACATYEANHQKASIACGDLRLLLTDLQKYKGIDLVFGGPPCQGFSVAGRMDPTDPRSELLWTFMDVVEIIRPKAFVCENVKALGVLKKWFAVRERLYHQAHRLGYAFKLVVLNAADFGVPQSRERMFLIGVRDIETIDHINKQFELRKRTSPKVRDILLPLGVAGSEHNRRICNAKVTIAGKPVLRKSPYAGMLFNGQGRPLNPDKCSSTLPATMGGNRTPIIDEAHCYFNQESWVEWYHSHLMKGGKPLPSDMAPKRLRRLTIDEAILLQTFPDKYDFKGGQSSIYRQIGNAVPCDLAYVVASVVRALLSGNDESFLQSFTHLKTQQLELAV